MSAIITTQLTLNNITEPFRQALKETFTIVNPKWLENDRLGRWNGKTPRVLKFYTERTDGSLIIPRGCLFKLPIDEWDDRRKILPEIDFNFVGQLRPFQQDAVKDIMTSEFGVLCAPTGSGKTVMALYIIAVRRQPALIIVHTKELLDQWINRIETFLQIPKDEVGIIGAGKQSIGEKVTVAMVQSLYKYNGPLPIGHLIIDEVHHCPSRTFTEAVRKFDSKYMLGLSATPYRRDKLTPLIFWYVGDLLHEVKKAPLIESGDVLPARVITRKTDFVTSRDPANEYSKMLSELTRDQGRNLLIASDIAQAAKNSDGVCLVLSDRKSHCTVLCACLEQQFGLSADLLTGDLSIGQRREVLARLDQGKVKILVATIALIGEGFDHAHLSTLFLATPMRFEGRVLQCLGRVLRPSAMQKEAVVYDYVDANVGVLISAAKNRQRMYKAQNG